MKQFLLPGSYAGEPLWELGDRDYHYLVRVKRLEAGNSFPGIDKAGNRYLIRIEEIREHSLLVRIRTEGRERVPEAGPSITLYQCLPKGNRMDLIIRQATEAGIGAIGPVISQYTVPAPGGARKERWDRIVREALQQSGAARPPVIENLLPLAEIPPISNDCDRGLFFHQAPLEIKPLHRYLSGSVSRVALVVGPEGGFSDSEAVDLERRGYFPVLLGTSILRTETAALYAIAAVQIVLSEKKTWVLAD